MNRLFRFVGCSLVLLSSCAAREEWNTVVDIKSEYSVDLPGKPENISRTADIQGETITIVGKLCVADNGYISCGVTVSTFPEEMIKDTDAAELFQSVANRTAESLPGAVITQEPETEFQGYPSELFVAKSGNDSQQNSIICRTVKVGNRVYSQMLTETAGRKLPAASRERFLNSFKITASVPKTPSDQPSDEKPKPKPTKAE